MSFSRKFAVALSVLLLVLLPRSASRSQEVNRDLLRQPWQAQWIASPDGPRREFGVFHFRKTFPLESSPQRFVIHVSGDNRYELFVNGARVLSGPARGDLNHWRFETLDIAPHLTAGRNVLAAAVWNFAERAPMAQMTNEAGLIVQGDGTRESVVNTDESWKSLRNNALEMIPWDPKKVSGYFVVGPGEQVDGSGYPWGWETRDYDDSQWKPALPLGEGGPRGIQDSASRWMLVPRNIPFMEEKVERLARIVRSDGVGAPVEFLQGRAPITVPAQRHATLLFDQTYLTTAYPELVVSGGRGAEITLTYAEALVKDHEKGNRNETLGKEILGFQDIFLPDGGEHRLFRPHWWRTFRYFQVEVETRSEPLVLDDLRGVFSAYPFTERAEFETDDPTLKKIWEVGWRTARLCAHETYVDCPYYEQLQYVGDTRIQALISLYLTGDDRLVKNAIEQISDSRTPEGLTQSRYPSFLPQYIPTFSLLWIGMMHDLWWYRGETEFLRQFLPGARNVLGWFESRLAPSGLLGRPEWWDFVDWTKDFEDGVPPQEPDGQSSILSLQFAAALRDAADLESSFGMAERAQHDRALATKITDAVYKTCWDPLRRLLADTAARRHFSQHANILAVLTGTIPAAQQQGVMRAVLADQALTQCSYYFRFYLFRAMKKAGLADQYLTQLGPWKEMLALGLTTWAETPEPTRSDCHAWSAHPNFDLLATVTGIEPAASAFREVAIQPHLGPLDHLTATLPHPEGEIAVRYRRQGTRLAADVSLPQKLSGSFSWNGRKIPLHGGPQHLEF
jgi:alpha-L-rhamnosidase